MLNTPLVILIGLLSALIGSFLNMLISRLPNHEYKSGSHFFSLLKHTSVPSSYCDHCKKPLKLKHLIPLFSFIKQSGKCEFCKQQINIQVFLVELITIIVGLSLFFTHNNLITFAWNFMFFSAGIVLSAIDFKHKILLDEIILPLVWLGLLANFSNTFVILDDALLGAVFGYLILWVLYQVYFLIRKCEGLGYGDFKLLAAVGAWFGWQILPLVLLLAAITALVYALITRQKQAIAFGPFIVLASFLATILPINSWLLP